MALSGKNCSLNSSYQEALHKSCQDVKLVIKQEDIEVTAEFEENEGTDSDLEYEWKENLANKTTLDKVKHLEINSENKLDYFNVRQKLDIKLKDKELNEQNKGKNEDFFKKLININSERKFNKEIQDTENKCNLKRIKDENKKEAKINIDELKCSVKLRRIDESFSSDFFLVTKSEDDISIKNEPLDMQEKNLNKDKSMKKSFIPKSSTKKIKSDVKKKPLHKESSKVKLYSQQVTYRERNPLASFRIEPKSRSVHDNLTDSRDNKPRVLFCSECSYRSASKKCLKAHLRIHCQLKLYECPVCNYKSHWIGNLKAHSRTHANCKQFQCSECKFKTNCKTTLKTHLLAHSQISLYSCDTCQFKSNYKSALKKHSLTHIDSKLFKCSKCTFETNFKDSFTVHELNHLQIKLYRCLECGYGTNRKDHYQSHVMTHSSAKRFYCTKCAYGTNRQYSLKIHLGTHIAKLFKCKNCCFKTNSNSHAQRHAKFRSHLIFER